MLGCRDREMCSNQETAPQLASVNLITCEMKSFYEICLDGMGIRVEKDTKHRFIRSDNSGSKLTLLAF